MASAKSTKLNAKRKTEDWPLAEHVFDYLTEFEKILAQQSPWFLKCRICGVEDRLFVLHAQKHAKETPLGSAAFGCEWCQKLFGSLHEIRSHLYETHKLNLLNQHFTFNMLLALQVVQEALPMCFDAQLVLIKHTLQEIEKIEWEFSLQRALDEQITNWSEIDALITMCHVCSRNGFKNPIHHVWIHLDLLMSEANRECPKCIEAFYTRQVSIIVQEQCMHFQNEGKRVPERFMKGEFLSFVACGMRAVWERCFPGICLPGICGPLVSHCVNNNLQNSPFVFQASLMPSVATKVLPPLCLPSSNKASRPQFPEGWCIASKIYNQILEFEVFLSKSSICWGFEHQLRCTLCKQLCAKHKGLVDHSYSHKTDNQLRVRYGGLAFICGKSCGYMCRTLRRMRKHLSKAHNLTGDKIIKQHFAFNVNLGWKMVGELLQLCFESNEPVFLAKMLQAGNECFLKKSSDLTNSSSFQAELNAEQKISDCDWKPQSNTNFESLGPVIQTGDNNLERNLVNLAPHAFELDNWRFPVGWLVANKFEQDIVKYNKFLARGCKEWKCDSLRCVLCRDRLITHSIGKHAISHATKRDECFPFKCMKCSNSEVLVKSSNAIEKHLKKAHNIVDQDKGQFYYFNARLAWKFVIGALSRCFESSAQHIFFDAVLEAKSICMGKTVQRENDVSLSHKYLELSDQSQAISGFDNVNNTDKTLQVCKSVNGLQAVEELVPVLQITNYLSSDEMNQPSMWIFGTVATDAIADFELYLRSREKAWVKTALCNLCQRNLLRISFRSHAFQHYSDIDTVRVNSDYLLPFRCEICDFRCNSRAKMFHHCDYKHPLSKSRVNFSFNPLLAWHLTKMMLRNCFEGKVILNNSSEKINKFVQQHCVPMVYRQNTASSPKDNYASVACAEVAILPQIIVSHLSDNSEMKRKATAHGAEVNYAVNLSHAVGAGFQAPVDSRQIHVSSGNEVFTNSNHTISDVMCTMPPLITAFQGITDNWIIGGEAILAMQKFEGFLSDKEKFRNAKCNICQGLITEHFVWHALRHSNNNGEFGYSFLPFRCGKCNCLFMSCEFMCIHLMYRHGIDIISARQCFFFNPMMAWQLVKFIMECYYPASASGLMKVQKFTETSVIDFPSPASSSIVGEAEAVVSPLSVITDLPNDSNMHESIEINYANSKTEGGVHGFVEGDHQTTSDSKIFVPSLVDACIVTDNNVSEDEEFENYVRLPLVANTAFLAGEFDTSKYLSKEMDTQTQSGTVVVDEVGFKDTVKFVRHLLGSMTNHPSILGLVCQKCPDLMHEAMRLDDMWRNSKF